MAPQDASGDGIDYSKLFVYVGPEVPDHSNMTTYASDSTEILGVPVQANIIGSSHYISAPGLNHRELTSCKPIEMARGFKPVMNYYDLTRGIDDVLIRTNGTIRAEVTIRTQALKSLKPENWDLCYTFDGDGPSAPTAIRFHPSGWETVHTYPEFDTELFTRTDFFKL